MRALPKINIAYWLTLVTASIFGTNTGDYVSDALGIGHLGGLPVLAALLLLIFVAERFSSRVSPLYFWAAIITIRTAATNVGDAFHDFGIGWPISLPAVLVAFGICVAMHFLTWSRTRDQSISASPVYWVTMMAAGVLGTIGGDAASFGLRLMPPGTALLFFFLAALAIIAWKRNNLLNTPLPYWITVALIRTGGTGAGDALAHALGIGTSTILTGAVFLAMTTYLYGVDRGNQIGSAVAADSSQ